MGLLFLSSCSLCHISCTHLIDKEQKNEIRNKKINTETFPQYVAYIKYIYKYLYLYNLYLICTHTYLKDHLLRDFYSSPLNKVL